MNEHTLINRCFFKYTGAHLCLRDGYDALPKAIAKGLDIRLNTAVNDIHYTADGEGSNVLGLDIIYTKL